MEGAVVVLFDMGIDWVSKCTSTLFGGLTSEPVLPGAAWAVLRAAAAVIRLGLATLGVVLMARTTVEAGPVMRDISDDCFFVLCWSNCKVDTLNKMRKSPRGVD